MANEAKKIIQELKHNFGWPFDCLRYGYNSDNRFISLDGRESWSPSLEVQQKIKNSLKKLETARKATEILAKIPWVKGVFVTGSVASLNAQFDDDIDFWLIVSPRRIWLTRALDWLIFTLRGKRRLAIHGVDQHKVADRFCFNFYTTTAALTLRKQNVSYAMQFVDAIPLWLESEVLYKELLQSNRWVEQYFPEWYKKYDAVYREISGDFNTQTFFVLDIFEYIAGVLMLLKSRHKLVLSPKNIFAEQFTTWGTERILSDYDEKTITERS